MGKRKKKNQGSHLPYKRVLNMILPVPDDQPNWPDDQRHEVMMSMSMHQQPRFFERDYIAVICPVAKRRTVVSYGGWTCSYNKLLNLDRKFQSNLPGGNEQSTMFGLGMYDFSILDCLHLKAERTFYILDVMQWNEINHYQSQTSVRFEWIRGMMETTDLETCGADNEYHFRPMPRWQCDRDTLYRALLEVPFKVDGILFFHRDCPYTPGTTSGVLWLPPQDIKSVLGWKPPPNIFENRQAAPPPPPSSTSTSSSSTAASTSACTSTSAGASASTSADV